MAVLILVGMYDFIYESALMTYIRYHINNEKLFKLTPKH
jgi:FMN-dependent NADH-azoreductase